MGNWIDRLGSPFEERIGQDNSTSLHFGPTEEEISRYGVSAARLNALTRYELPVQPGFIINTDLCRFYMENQCLPDGFEQMLALELEALSQETKISQVNDGRPQFLTCRASTQSKIAGVSGTIYHVGMSIDNAKTVKQAMELARSTNHAGQVRPADQRAANQFLRFLYQFSENVLGVTPDILEDLTDAHKSKCNISSDLELTFDCVEGIFKDYQELLDQEYGIKFPTDLKSQLTCTITAILKSWMSRRAIMQRQIQNIDENEGLAVLIRTAVFADFDGQSGQGYLDTRNGRTGEAKLSGGYSWCAPGEMQAKTSKFAYQLSQNDDDERPVLSQDGPEQFASLTKIAKSVEQLFGKSQRIGIVTQSGKNFITDCVDLQLSALAELKISVNLAEEEVITKNEAILRIDPISLEQLLHPSIDTETERTVIGSGVPASPGAASGEIIFTAEEAIKAQREGRKTILVRVETSPEDVHGMQRTEGILTIRGGMTSHAAVIARGMGTPCVCGAGNLRVDVDNETLFASGRQLNKGDLITLDGTRGEVLLGNVALRKASLSEEFESLMSWTDDVKRMNVRTNAESPQDVRIARQFGAQGVGLCRTEHMFFDDDRILTVREMILAETEEGRRAALDRLLPMQKSDFVELFEAANGQPITIRLLDPPLHEFLPQARDDIEQTAQAMGVDMSILHRRLNELREFNPMLGHRGCRLAISYPEITEMQARAILQAAIEAGERTGQPVIPEIMVPLVALKKELDFVKERIDFVAQEVMEESGQKVDYQVGTMIELPRAIIRADVIAQASDFFSFGTNDLTQMTFGISRDDASPFLKTYRQKAIIEEDPFSSLDFEGVGELIRLGKERGRMSKPDLKLGVCGEHGGDPDSVKFFDEIGLDYVSCSPFRVPIARLAAAQASICAKNRT